MIIESNLTGKIEKGCTGDIVWDNSLTAGPVVREGAEKRMMIRDSTFERFVHWRSVFESAECVSTTIVGENDCFEVVLTPPKVDQDDRGQSDQDLCRQGKLSHSKDPDCFGTRSGLSACGCTPRGLSRGRWNHSCAYDYGRSARTKAGVYSQQNQTQCRISRRPVRPASRSSGLNQVNSICKKWDRYPECHPTTCRGFQPPFFGMARRV